MDIQFSIFTILVTINGASCLKRKQDFRKTESTSNYYYPSDIANNRSNTGSNSVCAALTVINNGTAYSYSKESKTCLTYSKKICSRTAQDNVFSPGMTMYDKEADQEPTSCADVCPGVYTFTLPSCAITLDLSCAEAEDGKGSWTVFLRRFDGSENFVRTWNEYKVGFGDKNGEFWLGNDALHCLTSNLDQELRIDIETTAGAKFYAQYSSFSIGNSASNYKLTVGGYSGTAGDSLSYHSDAPFSTFDRDNDNNPTMHCANVLGAWWHKQASKFCCTANLNGVYGTYIWWFGISFNSHKNATMMTRKRP